MPADLRVLADRVEERKGQDRKLDRTIMEALSIGSKGLAEFHVWYFTSSIDAVEALRCLKLPNACATLLYDPRLREWSSEIIDEPDDFGGRSSEPARAYLAALLRAIAGGG